MTSDINPLGPWLTPTYTRQAYLALLALVGSIRFLVSEKNKNAFDSTRLSFSGESSDVFIANFIKLSPPLHPKEPLFAGGNNIGHKVQE